MSKQYHEKHHKPSELFDGLERKEMAEFACKAIDAVRADNSADEMADKTGRSPFCRDRDRILFSKAFRRLAHKTQVHLTSEKSPEHSAHTRTRLTHTLEVAQIAKTMARYLGMNEDLVEAIAFGHDVGHAPFGHAGEDQLNALLNGKVEVPVHYILEYNLDFESPEVRQVIRDGFRVGDFRHNFQSVRQLSFLDNYRGTFKGLNLTYQCLDGILRHTKVTSRLDPESRCKYPGSEDGLLSVILDRDGFKPTVEAKLVAVADEIAQVCHDLNDAVDLGIMSFDSLRKLLDKDGAIQRALKFSEQLRRVVNFAPDPTADGGEDNRKLCSLLIFYFTVKSTVAVGDILLDHKGKDILSFYRKLPKDPEPKGDFEYVKAHKNDIVINNYNVNRMDNKGQYIIRQLFYAYLTDPRQLPDSYLKLYIDIKGIKTGQRPDNQKVEAWFARTDAILKEGARVSESERKEIVELILDATDGSTFRKVNPKLLNKLIPYLLQDGDYVRTIVDYIASMTDTTAEKEVAQLYGY